MKYQLIFVWLLLFSTQLMAQKYEVLDVKRVAHLNGKRVKKGTLLHKYDTVKVSEEGRLMLDVESAMHMKLGPGVYRIGKEAKRHNAWYAKHLELTNYLKRIGMISCKFRYKTISVPGSDRHYEVDRIELERKELIRLSNENDPLYVKWYNPDRKFKSKYYVIVRDFYNNGFIDILETEENELTFYPGKYGHRHMVYNVLASDCRASVRYKIEAQHVKDIYLNETNYLSPD